MDSPSWMMYISIVVLILFSAFFSASETAISTFNRIRLKKKAQDGSAQAKRALKMADKYDRTLSAILIGNNIVNISASTIGTLIATAFLGAKGGVVSTAVMTLLILTFGEILPKSYAKAHADSVALRLSGLLSFFYRLLSPLSFLFTRLSKSFSTQPDAADASPSVTEEELMYILDSIEEEGVIEEEERDLVQSALEFDEIAIREIITPRVNLAALDIEDTQQEIIDTIINEGYSRMPVYENSVDNIIGILYTRDYLARVIRNESIDLRGMLSEPYFVHKGMKLSQLLANMKLRQKGMAVVLDEYGGTLGVVTMEDMVEELVGDIWDEDDEIPGGLLQTGEDCYEVDGSYDVQELFEELDEEEPETDRTTVSGWASSMLEHIPEAGESFDYNGLHCTVLEIDGNLVTKLGLKKMPPADTAKKTRQADGNT